MSPFQTLHSKHVQAEAMSPKVAQNATNPSAVVSTHWFTYLRRILLFVEENAELTSYAKA